MGNAGGGTEAAQLSGAEWISYACDGSPATVAMTLDIRNTCPVPDGSALSFDPGGLATEVSASSLLDSLLWGDDGAEANSAFSLASYSNLVGRDAAHPITVWDRYAADAVQLTAWGGLVAPVFQRHLLVFSAICSSDTFSYASLLNGREIYSKTTFGQGFGLQEGRGYNNLFLSLDYSASRWSDLGLISERRGEVGARLTRSRSWVSVISLCVANICITIS